MENLEQGQSLDGMKLFDTESLKCPYHYDRSLREAAPVYQDPESGVFAVSTYELVREAHRAKNVFSNEFTLALGSTDKLDPEIREATQNTYDLGKGTLLTLDEPGHTMFRDAVKELFTATVMARHEPWIRDLARTLADKLATKNECDFIQEFTRPLPLSVIMHVLGIPLEEFDRAFQWTLDNVTVLSQVADQDKLLAAHHGLKDEYDWFVAAMAERTDNPRDDLLTKINDLRVEGRELTVEEKLSFCTQFLVAGNETTTATLAEGMRQLCLNPEQEQLIRADRSLIPNLVEESLRLASPTSNMWRVTKSDYELGGVLIPEGSAVLLKYFSSNHDPAMFEEPMKFDVQRANLRRHIAFGFGNHVCIGQHLSKLEMTIAWEELFDRFENFSLAIADGELEYMPNILLRGLEEIPIRYTVVGA
ncbi:MAG: cytochrome P450 [Halioglobus sp.]|nr:cytochrome P450 [Halioglobus sp.]MDG2327405.1 cytochrome P450 [Halioglobus sp.]